MTIAEAASVCGCELGTIKSRVNRARVRLAELLDGDADDLIGDGERIAPAVADGPDMIWPMHANATVSSSRAARAM